MIIVSLALLLLQASPAAQTTVQQPSAGAAIAGIVIRAGTRDPIPNVRVSLARIDNSVVKGIADLLANDLPGEDLVIRGEQIPLLNAVAKMESTNVEIPATRTGPLLPPLSPEESRFEEVVIGPSGTVAV